MADPLTILHLESNSFDGARVKTVLQSAGLACRIIRVASEKDFTRTLELQDIDIVFSAFTVPGFDGLTALELTRNSQPDLPFIFISRTIGEDRVAEVLKQGATDYVNKDRLGRLANTVERAHREVFEKRKQRESTEALKRSQQQLSTLMANLPGIAYRCRNDEHWTIEFVSEGIGEILGYTADEAYNDPRLTWTRLMLAEDRERVRNQVDDALRENRPFVLEYRVQDRDGQIHWVWEKGVGIRGDDDEVRYLEGFISDISEKKNYESKVLRTQRLENIGALAGGIAHDLNNILSPIMMGIDILRLKLSSNSDAEPILETLEKSTQRGAGLIRQILTFCRGTGEDLAPVSIRHVMGEIARIIEDTFPVNIELRTSIASDIRPVVGNPTLIHQVLLNLAVNARDAMPDGGLIEISARNVRYTGNQPASPVRNGKGDSYLRLSVKDSGCGIPTGSRERIFEPYYTTKASKGGTGLGLSTVKSIVEKHNGFIELKSEENRGTAFHIYLPSETEDAAATTYGPHHLASLQGNDEYILVADDERSIRQIIESTLQSCGFRVLLADNGTSALEMFAEQADKIAAVLTDLTMPGKNGYEVASAVKAMSPDTAVILIGGLIDGEEAPPAEGCQHVRCLGKPFSVHALLSALEEALAARRNYGRAPT